MTTKDLAYYMDHPEELDEAAMAQLASTEEGPSDDPEADEAAAKAEAEATPPPPLAEAEATPPPAEEAKTPVEPVIATRDGKHVIPHAVLQGERERANAAERQLAEMQAKMREMEKAQAEGTKTPEASTEGLDQETLEALRADYPAFAKVIDSLSGRLAAYEEKLAKVQQAEESRFTREAAVTRNAVDEAVDRNPTLAYLRAENPAMFEAACRYDDMIRANPLNRDLSIDDRFAKVVRALEIDYGAVEVPAKYQPAQVSTKNTGATDVAAAVKAAEKAEVPVRSLSQIPGGVPPAASEAERIQGMSVTELEGMMDKLSPDEINRLLLKVA